MNKPIHTENAPPPFSAYTQATEAPAGSRWVHVSGQVGTTPDGILPGTAAEQHDLAWRNVVAVLDAAGMGVADIVEVLAIVTDHDQVPLYRDARDRALGGHECASTMLVCGLASPDWKVEVAVRAAQAQ